MDFTRSASADSDDSEWDDAPEYEKEKLRWQQPNPLDPLDKGGMPDTVRRKCTDSVWLLVFAVALAVLAYVMYVGYDRGNLDSIRALSDWQGHVCGKGVAKDTPYLFFCQERPGRLNFMPICVQECPRSANTSRQCYVNSTRNQPGRWEEVKDYPSYDFIGLLCKPMDQRLVRAQQEWINQNPPIASLSTLRRAWHPLLLCAVLAVFNSYVYIFLLKQCASCLVWTGLTILTLVPLGTGGWCLFCWHNGGCGDTPNAAATDLTVGIVLLMVGVLFGCATCRLGDSIDLAIACITWSCKCVLETPSLKIQPLVTLTLRTGTLAAIILSFSLLLSLGHDDPALKRLTWDFDILACMVVLCLLAFWIQHIITSASAFVTIYVTQMWYFRGGLRGEGGAPVCSVFRAHYVCIRYHLGSIIFGALVIGFVQPVRLLVGAFTSAARMEDNPVGVILGGCCGCLVECYETLLDHISRNAYMDMALNAGAWCEAADHALQVIRSEADTVQILNGATWLFQFAGLGGIVCIGHALTLGILRGYPSYTKPESPLFVPNPEVECIVGAVLSGAVAFPFMMLFDVVSDTILYCRTVDRQRKWKPTLMERACVGGIANFVGEVMGIGYGNCVSRPLRPEQQTMSYAEKPHPEEYNDTNPFNSSVASQRSLAVVDRGGASPGNGKGRGKGRHPHGLQGQAERAALLSP